MPYYDNPAGRLHELLRALSERNPKESLLAAWAAVLGVNESDVVLHIGGVADLLSQIQEVVDRLDDNAVRAPVARYRATWARTVFPSDQPFNGQLAGVLPGPESLELLDLLSAQLHVRAPEGAVPDDDELNGLKQQLRDLRDEVVSSDDLPENLKDAIITRLMDVETAIEHVHVGGPEAVRRAMEAVMGAVMFAPEAKSNARTPAIQKVWATLAVVWTVFAAGPVIQNSLDAWSNIVHEIPSGHVVTGDEDHSDRAVEPKAPSRESPN